MYLVLRTLLGSAAEEGNDVEIQSYSVSRVERGNSAAAGGSSFY